MKKERLLDQLEAARLQYKPKDVSLLLIAEAPPDGLDRFFYYDAVRTRDYLFLGITETLFPELKKRYIAQKRPKSVKREVLLNLKSAGLYLLDLSELPLSLTDKSLGQNVPALIDRVRAVINPETKIILIKATVYDAVFRKLHEVFPEQVIDRRIPFPSTGNQKNFQLEFTQAIKESTWNSDKC